jgi:hypothetical protein
MPARASENRPGSIVRAIQPTPIALIAMPSASHTSARGDR